MENYSTIDQFEHLENIDVDKEKFKKKKKRIATFISSKFSEWFSADDKAVDGKKADDKPGAADRIKDFLNLNSKMRNRENQSVDLEENTSRKSFRELISLALDKLGLRTSESELRKHPSAAKAEDSPPETMNTTDVRSTKEISERDGLVRLEDSSETAPAYLYEEEEVMIHHSKSSSLTLHEKTEVRITEKLHAKKVRTFEKELKKRDKEISKIAQETDELAKENYTIQSEIDSMKMHEPLVVKETAYSGGHYEKTQIEPERKKLQTPINATKEVLPADSSVKSKETPNTIPSRRFQVDKPSSSFGKKNVGIEQVETKPKDYSVQQNEQVQAAITETPRAKIEMTSLDAGLRSKRTETENESTSLKETARNTPEMLTTRQPVTSNQKSHPLGSVSLPKPVSDKIKPISNDETVGTVANKSIEFMPADMSTKEMAIAIGLIVSLALTIVLLAQSIVS